MSNQVAANEQGQLQGALTSLVSITAAIGPFLMSSLFTYFAKPDAEVHFPGAAMMMGALLTLVSAVMARFSLKKTMSPVSR
jgi:DHA1 family tetracycline resistance protein-like MFS transporter